MIIVSLKNLSAYYKLEKQAQKLSFQANKRLSKVNSKNLQDLPKYGHERSRYIAGHSQPQTVFHGLSQSYWLVTA